MATEKQNAANKLNAQKSTGPSTPSGKEASARNALKHGLSAKKYLTSSETIEEFAALYAARRRHYPPDDPIIDRLVEKITLAHFRIGRGFEAEGDGPSQGSLAEMLVHCENHGQIPWRLRGEQSQVTQGAGGRIGALSFDAARDVRP